MMATKPIANLLRMAKDIQMWLVDKLIPYARSPRTYSDAQIAQIAASISEFGFLNPILVDTKAGIIARHGRLLAARKLGLTEVPVIVLDHLIEAQKRAYVIADHKLAENAGWDDEMLRIETEALQAGTRTPSGQSASVAEESPPISI
jgi:ParB-like chromosome segregation protein Spo0J